MNPSTANPQDAEAGDYLRALRWKWLTPTYDAAVRLTTGERRFKELLVARADLSDGERVLDVGCGTGTLLVSAAGQARDLQLVGVDRDEQMLRRAAAKSVGAGIDLELHVGDATRLPLADDGVDVAVSSLFFHHLRSGVKSAALAELVRVLRPGGRLAIADWGAPRSAASRLGASFIRAFDGAEPTRDNLDGRLAEIIEGAGFVEVRMRDRLGVPLGVIDLITARTVDQPGT